MCMFFAAIHCAWGLWGEWTTCSTTCGDGNLTRQRVHAILAQYGGNNCTGNSMDTKHCNIQDDLRAKIAQLEQTNADLQVKLNKGKYVSKSCRKCSLVCLKNFILS